MRMLMHYTIAEQFESVLGSGRAAVGLLEI